MAITRAKHKLVMVGDSASLGQYSPFEKFFSILHSNQNVSFLILEQTIPRFSCLLHLFHC